jgi:hypothetical protein
MSEETPARQSTPPRGMRAPLVGIETLPRGGPYCLSEVRPPNVGSCLARAPVGAGGLPTTFAVDLSPANIVTFPAPATSNAACRFPASTVLDHI